MNTAVGTKVKQLLQATAAGTQGASGDSTTLLPRAAPRLRKSPSSTIVVGQHMTPLGCSCAVATLGRAAPANGEVRRHARRIILAQMVPGTIVRTSPRYYESIVSRARLPTARHCYMRSLRAGNHVPSWERLPALPCPLARQGGCGRCPWMAVAEASPELSASLKADVVRAHVDAVTTATSDGVMASPSPLTTRRVRREDVKQVDYLEPLSVPAQLHALQLVTYLFKQEVELPDVPADAAPDPEANVDPALTDHLHPAPRSGSSGAFVLSGEHSTSGAACLLSTLEQKRLQASLTRWAQQLPTSMRQALQEVSIAQPSHPCARQPWESDLAVRVRVERDVLFWGPQSPFCGPSQPPRVLAVEEQKLLDAVLGAAPLIKQIVVEVEFMDSGEIDELYPHLRRAADTATDSGTHAVDSVAFHGDSHVRKPPSFSVGCCFTLACWCAPLQCEVSVHLPLATFFPRYRANRKELTLRSNSLAFWRQATALEAACSVLTSLCLDGIGKVTELTNTALYIYDHQPPQHAEASQGQQREGVAAAAEGTAVLASALSAVLCELFSAHAPSAAVYRCTGKRVAPVQPSSEQASCTTQSATHAPSRVMVAAVLTDGGFDSAALLRLLHHHVCPAASEAKVRVLLVQCSADLTMHPLKSVLETLVSPTRGVARQKAKEESATWQVDAVRCGLVDVDPLAASFVPYVVLDLSVGAL